MSEGSKKGYDAQSVEAKWYASWQQAGLFEADSNESKPKYTITIPPPNITGSLHMGHALCYSLQDLLGRYKRMTGHSVLILPGQDHAGIATQTVVTKQLKAQGQTPTELGREAFLQKVWDWRKESGDTIINQLQSIGCAFDWNKLRFTLDDQYHEAVLKVFIDWFERGLIYRGLRVINWDPVLKTSVSDIETERKEITGKLYHIKYPFTDGSGEIIIATTRPETMLADVAVAVHPSDKRYHGKTGKTLRLPLTDREIPLIEDEYPDPEFGTGAVKITPAHDANDFEVGQRHNLPILFALNEDARVTDIHPKYQGQSREEARKNIVADLEAQGFLHEIEDHRIAVIISDRSKEIIEPYASEQWFVDQKSLAQPAIQVVEQSQITFHPERFKGIYLDWLNNIRDWCISRQLWWGHRIPVYYTEDGTPFAALNWQDAQAKAGDKKIVRQDDDVLDTWFSSGLWPFATLGWPQETPDLSRHYPTDVLVTARDILYLWVARMVMMGMDFQKEIPFKNVYIYATVLTEDGKRMSKSLGTGVDPMDIISDKGADALRYTLLSQTGLNQDLRYSEKRTVEGRNFCNKIWNASRFVLLNLEGYDDSQPSGDTLQETDQWILSRLAKCEATVRKGYDNYDIQSAIQSLYQFFWSELCDWYIEMSKSRLQDPSQKAIPQYILLTCLTAFLKMLHPAMPYITEEVYELLPIKSKKPFIMQESWPEIPAEWQNSTSEAKVEGWLEVIRTLRAIRAEMRVPALRSLPIAYIQGDVQGGEETIRTQAWFDKLIFASPTEKCVSDTIQGIDVHLPIAGLVNEEQEVERLKKDLAKSDQELAKLSKRLSNPAFIQNAKPEYVQQEKEAAQELEQKIEKIKKRIQIFS